MKLKTSLLFTAVSVAGILLAAPPAQAQTLTSYSDGDLFIGFRQTGTTNTLVVNIGSAAQFIPTSLGGTAEGSFNVTFGLIPNTATPVSNINADLSTVFGNDWATASTPVQLGIIGWSSGFFDDVPVNGLVSRSIFLSKARTNPAVQTTPSASYNLDGASGNFGSFLDGVGNGSYLNQLSTANSDAAFIGLAAQSNNWNQRIGANGSFGLGSSRSIEGATSAVFDLYLSPYDGSTLVDETTYLGSFTLSNTGVLTYTTAGTVPEPSTFGLVALSGTALLVLRRRQQAKSALALI